MAGERTSDSGFERSWFVMDASSELIDFAGQDAFRFPEELARMVVEAFSNRGDVVLDPFAGVGVAVAAADALGRTAIGIERDRGRAAIAAARVAPPSKVLHAELSAKLLDELPLADLVFTSPPHITFGEWDDEGVLAYWDDFDRLFASLSKVMKATSLLVVHLANPKGDDGIVRTVGFEAAIHLARLFNFVGEYVRCTSGELPVASGVEHSYLFVYRLEQRAARHVADVTPNADLL